MFRAIFCGFLGGDEIGVTIGFGFYLLAVHQVTQLVHKQVEGASVEDKVMHVVQKVNPLLSGDDFHAVERPKSQVERLDELPLVLLHFRLASLTLCNFNRLFKINDLNNFRTCSPEMWPHLRMRLDDGLHGLCELGSVGVLGETNQRGDII